MPWSKLKITLLPATLQLKLLEFPVAILLGVAIELEMTGVAGAVLGVQAVKNISSTNSIDFQKRSKKTFIT